MADVRYIDHTNCLTKISLLDLPLSNNSTECLPILYPYFVSFLFISFLIFSRISTAYDLFFVLLLIPHRLSLFLFVQLLILVSSYRQFLLQGDPLSNVPSTHEIVMATKLIFLSLVDGFPATTASRHNLSCIAIIYF